MFSLRSIANEFDNTHSWWALPDAAYSDLCLICEYYEISRTEAKARAKARAQAKAETAEAKAEALAQAEEDRKATTESRRLAKKLAKAKAKKVRPLLSFPRILADSLSP